MRWILILLLAAAPAWAQEGGSAFPPDAAGGGYDGGVVTNPFLAPEGCTVPGYSFENFQTLGMCKESTGSDLRIRASELYVLGHYVSSTEYAGIRLSSNVSTTLIKPVRQNTTPTDLDLQLQAIGTTGQVTLQATGGVLMQNQTFSTVTNTCNTPAYSFDGNGDTGFCTDDDDAFYPAGAVMTADDGSISASFAWGRHYLWGFYTNSSNYEGLFYNALVGGDHQLLLVTNGTGNDNIDLQIGAAGTGAIEFLSELGSFTQTTGSYIAIGQGSAAGPGLRFEGDTDAGMFQEAGNEINFAANGTEIVEFRHQPAVGDNFYLLNHTNTGAQQGFSYQGTTTASSINLSTPGDTAPDYVVSCVNGTGCSARLNGDEGFARFTVRDNTAANLAFRFGNAGETTYIDLKPAALTGTQTITVPDTTGTILVGGGTNVVTLGSVAFASLPAGGAGQMIFCSDCDLGSTPCASTPGPGTLAVHNGAAWNCQ